MVSNVIDTSNKALLLSLKLKKKGVCVCGGAGGGDVHRLFTKIRAVCHHRSVSTHLKGIRIL